MKLDIDCLKSLHSGQLHQLRVFIETLGYRKAAERASEEFNQPIHKSALQRFMRRAAPAEFLEDTPEKDEATRQILKFAADGQPDFTGGTLRALEQLAFQLAFTCTAVDDDMHALSKISTMLCRFRNAATRERMAAVQEGKLKLRQQQFDKSNNHDSDAYIQDLNKKIADAFDSHPVLTAIEKGEMGRTGASPVPAGASPAENVRSNTAAAPVPPKNKKSKRSLVAPKRSEGGSSAKSVKSAVNPSFPTHNEPQTNNNHEIRNT